MKKGIEALKEVLGINYNQDTGYFDAYRFYRDIYKESAGGVCIQFKFDGLWNAGDDLPRKVHINLVEEVQITCIVEGTDAEFCSNSMDIDEKFTEEWFWGELEELENLVEEYCTENAEFI